MVTRTPLPGGEALLVLLAARPPWIQLHGLEHLPSNANPPSNRPGVSPDSSLLSSKYMKSFSINKHYFGISGHQQSWQQHFPFFVFFCFLNEQQQPGQKPRGPPGAPVTGPSWCPQQCWALGTSPAWARGADADSAARVPEAARRGGEAKPREAPGGGAAETHPEGALPRGRNWLQLSLAPGRPGLGSVQGQPSPPLGAAGQVAPTPAASV